MQEVTPRRPRWHEPEWTPDHEELCIGGKPITECWATLGLDVHRILCPGCR
jgi:hypothetical protein